MDTKNPIEHLENFMRAIIAPEALVKDVMQFLTATQQHEAKFVGRITPVANINGIHSVLKDTKKWIVKEKANTNPLVFDAIIKLVNYKGEEAKLQCRLVKEIGVRSASPDGEWGVNVNSFKYIK